jgi:pyruvate,water dikinase
MSWWENIFPRRPRTDSFEEIRRKLEAFHELQADNNRALELIAQAEEMLGGEFIFDRQSLKALARDLEDAVASVVDNLNRITDGRYPGLRPVMERVRAEIQAMLESRIVAASTDYLIPLEKVDANLTDAVGEKMARLGEMGKRLECRTPAGFVISAHACQLFLEDAGVLEAMERLFDQPAALSHEQMRERAADLGGRVLKSELPRDLARAIRRGVKQLERKSGSNRFAVRSSALGEDGELSFAGQFETVLGVPSDDALDAYKRVVASLYSPAVMRYRLDRQLHPARGLMAVGCLCMVAARASGVVYTLDPTAPERDVILISAAWGLGRMVVEGTGHVDQYEITREQPHRVVTRTVARKEERYMLATPKGVERVAVPTAERDEPCLQDEAIEGLVAMALRIERHMRRAQDIEWALDDAGRLFILQARPLQLMPHAARVGRDLSDAVRGYPVLLRDQGNIACRGIGAGQVCIVGEKTNVDELPPHAVLVARTSTPRLATAVETAAAVITDVGTATGHLSTIAREYGIPAIVDAKNATQVLKDEREVTVDAEENVVYRGRVGELVRYQLVQYSKGAESAEFKLLRGLLKRIAPLNLRDPNSPRFVAESCATYHDIIRFAHEKAVAELTEGSRFRLSRQSQRIRELDLHIPLDLILIDVGGGLAVSPGSKKARVEEVTSRPLRALLAGLTVEGVWLTEPADMDLDGFMSSATRSMSLAGPSAGEVEHNLAIISDAYMNLNLHLGYHFNVVDCYLSNERNENYIYFRFVGGVTEMTRRLRRTELLRRILEAHDFVVEARADLVYGRIKKITTDAMIANLEMIGRLIGFTRQLDILLRDDSLVEKYASKFLENGRGSAPGRPSRAEERTST